MLGFVGICGFWFMGFIFIHSGPDMSFFQYFGMLGLRQ
jgi:hypothetical protein